MEKRRENPQRLEPFRLRLDKTQNAAFPLVMATYNGEIAQVSTILSSMTEDSLAENINRPCAEGLTALAVACCIDKPDIVELLLSFGAKIDTIRGTSPLHFATRNKNVNCVAALLHKGCNLNTIDGEGNTALHVAVRTSSAPITQLLVDAGAELNKKDYFGRTPLHWACILGEYEILFSLLTAEILPNHRISDGQGRTAVMLASEYGKMDCLEGVINEYKLSEDEINKKDHSGLTALHLAALNGHKDCVERLLEERADIHAVDKFGRTAVHAAASSGYDVIIKILLEYDKALLNAVDENGRTPLFYACKYGWKKTVKLLLGYAPNIKITDKCGYTALHWLTFYGHYKCLGLFKDLDFPEWLDKNGNTLVHSAASNSQNKCISFLLHSSRMDANRQNNKGRYPIHHCAKRDLHECLKLLLSKGAEMNATDNQGRTVLHASCFHGAMNCIRVLLERGVQTGVKDSKQRIPLHIFSRAGKASVVRNLIKNSASDLGVKDALGRIPLHYACLYANIELVRFYLQSGVDPETKDNEGRTPVHMAALRGDRRSIDELKNAKAKLNEPDNLGITPAFLACFGGHIEAFTYILDSGEIKDINQQDKFGRTLLHAACHIRSAPEFERGAAPSPSKSPKLHRSDSAEIDFSGPENFKEIVQKLVFNGADVNKEDANKQTPLLICAKHRFSAGIVDFLKECSAKIEAVDKEGNNAFHLSALYKNTEVLKRLLSWEPESCTQKNKNGWTPLHFAACSGNVEVVDMLTEHCQSQINDRDNKGRTAIHLCAFYNYKRALNAIALEGGEIEVKDNAGETPLHYAAYSGSVECSDLLMERGASEVANKKGRTALHLAAIRGFSEVVDLLVDMKFEVDARDKKGKTALMYACSSESSETVKKLVEKGASINVQDKLGVTPMMVAASRGKKSHLEVLLQNGAKLTIHDKKGRNALRWALDKKHRDCFLYLRSQLSPNDVGALVGMETEQEQVKVEVAPSPVMKSTEHSAEPASPQNSPPSPDLPESLEKGESLSYPSPSPLKPLLQHEDKELETKTSEKPEDSEPEEEWDDRVVIVENADSKPKGSSDKSTDASRALDSDDNDFVISKVETFSSRYQRQIPNESPLRSGNSDRLTSQTRDSDATDSQNAPREKLLAAHSLKSRVTDLDQDIAKLELLVESKHRVHSHRLDKINRILDNRRSSMINKMSDGLRSEVRTELQMVPSVVLYGFSKQPNAALAEVRELMRFNWLVTFLLVIAVVLECVIVVI